MPARHMDVTKCRFTPRRAGHSVTSEPYTYDLYKRIDDTNLYLEP